jgi:hypothetical protein
VDFWTGTSSTFGTLVFWYLWYFVKLGFHFPGIQPLKRCAESSKQILRGGCTFLDAFGAEKLHHKKTLFFMYDNSDVFHFSLVKYALFGLALIPC